MDAASPRRSLSRAERLLAVGFGFWLLVAIAGAVAFYAQRNAMPDEPALPVLYPVAPFTFTDENGASFSSEALKGKVWAANFIFTRCPSICPMFTKKMGEVQKGTLNLDDKIHLVSFTVDPAYDKPDVLKAYAKEHHADPSRWTFLTGDREALKHVIVDEMKIHLSEETDDLMALAHGGHFVLVDRDMKIRGYYNSEDEDAVQRLVHDAGRLVAEPD